MQIMRAATSFQRKHFVFNRFDHSHNGERTESSAPCNRVGTPYSQPIHTGNTTEQGGYPNIVHMVVNTGDFPGFTPSMTTEADVLRRGMKS